MYSVGEGFVEGSVASVDGVGDLLTQTTFPGSGLVVGSQIDSRGWRTATWEPGRIVAREPGVGPVPLACSSAGRWWALLTEARAPALFDAIRGTACLSLPAPEAGLVACLRFSPDGQHLAVGERSGRIHLWSLGALARELAARGLARDLGF